MDCEMDALATFQLAALTDVGGFIIPNQTRPQLGVPPASVMNIRFPALVTLGAGATGIATPTPLKRMYDLSMSAFQLARTDTSFDFSNLVGMRSLLIGASFTNVLAGLHIEDNPDLTSLALGPVPLGKSLRIRRNNALKFVLLARVSIGDNVAIVAQKDLEIGNNIALDSVKFGGGRVAGTVLIRFNNVLSKIFGPMDVVLTGVSIHDNPLLPQGLALAWALSIPTVAGQIRIENNKSPTP